MSKKKRAGLREQIADRRGAADIEAAREWSADHGVEDVECLIPDQAGVARGKIMPASKFFDSPSMNMPSSIFHQTISGDYADDDGPGGGDPTDADLVLRPDWTTLSMVPWASDATAQVIHDAFHRDGRPAEVSPRQLLKHVIDLYAERGWSPIIAPEIEFYLVKPNLDPDYPLEPPIGRSGRPESGRQSYSISAVNEFEELFEDIYAFSEAQGLEIDTLIHEEGTAQMEINLRHGPPVELADQVFLFKRTIREAALKHKMYATFMAKPMANQPGSAMHIHQSVRATKGGENIFTDEDGAASEAFFSFLGGSQRYLPAVMCVLAPYVNSYRRLTRASSAPINVAWGYDNRTTGIRVPPSNGEARRVENRVPSSDANPYLAIAASLACGYLGMVEKAKPAAPIEGSAHGLDYDLPRGLLDAVAAFESCEPLRAVFGETFVQTYAAVKRTEFETFMRVISPWEREHLLLNV